MSTPIKASALPCPYPGCSRVFELMRHLNRHAEIHDPKTKRFACPWADCDHTTRQRSNLKTHIKKHTNTKDLSCSKCTYATGDPALLLRHEKRVHGYKPRTTRKRRYTMSEVSSSSSGSDTSSPTSPVADVKPELDNWHAYPFEDSFTSVQAKPLYPATEAIPALSYTAFDVDTLFSAESGYGWFSLAAPVEKTESLDSWSSWAPTPTSQAESRPASFDWSTPLDYNFAHFTTPSPEAPYLPTSSTPSGVPYIEQSLEQFFSFALPETSSSLNGASPSEPVYGSYLPAQLSSLQPSANNAFFNGLY
ncbi:hypothetical protein BDZ89DRAFT_1160894 [Hymenopellis radicata]|nr:hypothetical protein BDZ89DRAFT_1160894 [Hymenopellis radicata]